MVKVSIIIPIWNAQMTIEATIKSVLAQSISDYEILVCDDGSTDDSEKIVREINDTRIRWIQGSRGGRPAIPRNVGIKESKGEWIAFLDSDDIWAPSKLEKQFIKLEESKLKACATNAFRYLPNIGIKGEMLNVNLAKITFKELIKCNFIICSSTLIHKNLIMHIEGFPEDENLKAVEDYCLWLRVACLTDFCYIEEPLVIYRDDADNSIRSKAINNYFQQKFLVINNLIKWVEQGNLIKKISYSQIKKELLTIKFKDFLNTKLKFVYKNLKHIKRLLNKKNIKKGY